MSEISRLAQNFEQRSSELAASTDETVRRALKEHEKRLRKALSESESRISADIQGQHQRLAKTAAKSWLAVLIPVVITLLLAAGTSWWLGNRIQDQIQTTQRLEEAGGEMQLGKCGESQRLCVKIDPEAPAFKGGYRIPEGY
jgi:hypothetical protein